MSFFEVHSSSPRLARLVRGVSWSQDVVILERCPEPLERELYLRTTRGLGWSKKVLNHPIGKQPCRIVKQLPKALKNQLPSPEQIGRTLEDGV